MRSVRCATAGTIVLATTLGCSDPVGSPGGAEPRLATSAASTDLVEVVVAFRDSVGAGDLAFISRLTARAPKYRFSTLPALAIHVPQAAFAQLRANPRVRYAETGRPIYALSEFVGWQHQNLPAGDNIQRFTSGSSTPNGAGVVVGFIDSGINCSGPDRPYGCVGGADFSGEGSPFNSTGPHGTETSSLVVASRDNNLGIRGIAPLISLFSLRVFDSYGQGSCLWAAQAIDWAVANLPGHATQLPIVLNMSYGSSGTTSNDKANYDAYCQSEKDAVARGVAANVLMIASAGNVSQTGDSVAFPARLPGVAAVSGLTCGSRFSGEKCVQYCTFTCITPHSKFWGGSGRGTQVDFAAPADNMYVLMPSGGYTVRAGTSFAAPVVTGIAALTINRWSTGNLSAACVITHLKNTAYWPGQASSKGYYGETVGSGQVDGYKAYTTAPAC